MEAGYTASPSFLLLYKLEYLMRAAADLYDLAVLEAETRRRAANAGLSVVFQPIPTPAYDYKHRKVLIPTLRMPCSSEDIDYLRAGLIHEIGHANRLDTIKRIEAANINMDKPFGRILNIVEDCALERELAAEWAGDAHSLGVGHDIHTHKQMAGLQAMRASAAGLVLTPEETKINGAYILAETTRDWDRWSAASRHALASVVPDEVKEVAAQLAAGGWAERIKAASTADEVFDVAKALYKVLFPEDPHDPEAPESSQNEQGGASDDGKAGGSEGEGEGAGEKPTDKKKKINRAPVPWRLLSSAPPPHGGTPDEHAKVDYSGHVMTRRGWALLPTSRHKPRGTYATPLRTPPTPPIMGTLRRLLQSEARSKFEFGLTSGKLDQRKLAKLALPVAPGGDSWRKVFKKRVPGRKINTAVQILVDGSGSMSGHKNLLAAGAADALVGAFAGPLRIKTAVHAFDADHENRIWDIKEFNEVVQPGVVANRLRGVGFSGNADGEALLWAMGNILPRAEKRKIILVLSDGMPTDSASGVDAGSTLKLAIQAVRKRGIQVYGIGIVDWSVTHFYGKDCQVITDLAKLPDALVTTLQARV